MALEHFQESCPKRYLEEIDRRDLQCFTAFLIGRKEHAPRTARSKVPLRRYRLAPDDKQDSEFGEPINTYVEAR